MRWKLMITACLLAAPALQGATAAERPNGAQSPRSEGPRADRKRIAETAEHGGERGRSRFAWERRDSPADREREREEHDNDHEHD